MSSFFLKRFFQNPSLLSFSFPLLKLFSFYFLSSIFKISKCLISLNIGCLIKTPLKTALKQFFKGGTPSATLIFNSMFVVGVLYCVQLFIDVFSFVQNPSLLSFSSPLLKFFSFYYFLSSILFKSQNI